MPAASINGLRHNPMVKSVELDGKLERLRRSPTGDLEYDNAWGVEHIGAGRPRRPGNTGQGVKVAIIDTGIDYIHDDPDNLPYVVDPEFLGTPTRAATTSSTTTPTRSTTTATARTSPASWRRSTTARSSSASRRRSTLRAQGPRRGRHRRLQRPDRGARLRGRPRIDVVNMSLGGHERRRRCRPPSTNALRRGRELVAASGNAVDPPGAVYGCPVAYPAAYPRSSRRRSRTRTTQLTGYSCTGPQVDFASPGDQINSTVPPGSCMFCSPDGYAAESGTSMASPHLAGVVALVLRTASPTRTATLADDVKAHLCATAGGGGAPARPKSRELVRLRHRRRRQALLTYPPPPAAARSTQAVAVADTASVTEDAGPTTIDVLATIPIRTPDDLTVTSVTDPAKGSATVGTGGRP